MTLENSMDCESRSAAETCAVVYLARGVDNGAAKAVEFFLSYDRHSAGRSHDLVVITKGWENRGELAIVQELAHSHSARIIELPDDGYDLGSYFRVTPFLTHEYVCFLNSNSVILHDNWLACLFNAASRNGVGVASSSGNWNTAATFSLVNFFQDFRTANFGSLKRYPRYWCRTLFRILPKIPAFPNPHVRTNGFIVRKCLWEKFVESSVFPATKLDCWALEHGRKGLSRFIERHGLSLVVVGANGETYRRDEWPQSGTFSCPNLSNLLIADNQSTSYRNLSPYEQWIQENKDWGRSPRQYPGYMKYSLKGSLRNWIGKISRFAVPGFKKTYKRLHWIAELIKRQYGPYDEELDGSPLFFKESDNYSHGGSDGAGAYAPSPGVLMNPHYRSLSVVTAPQTLSIKRRVNLLIPSSSIMNTSGGPNTAYALIAELVRQRILVRVLSVSSPADHNDEAIRNHVMKIGNLDAAQAASIEFVDASAPNALVMLGAGDVFLATAWWTAQMAKAALPLFDVKRFIYLIQDFEPLLYEASSSYIMANETYSFDFLPVFNTSLLRDYFIENRVGNFSCPTFANASLYFEPAFNRSDYFPENNGKQERKHRLFFYARPNAKRNLIDFGVAALMKVIAQGDCNPENWEFYASDTGVGGRCREIVLRNYPEVRLSPLPVHTVDAWAKEMRRTDIMLSLIMSPHPSYPPYEAAASGALVVTNTWSVKTKERLEQIFPSAISAQPTIDDIAAALSKAMYTIESRDPTHERRGDVICPHSWEESFQDVMPGLMKFLADCGITPEK